MKRSIILITIISLCACQLLAQSIIWKVDKPHSQVNFSVTHLLIAEVTGRFTDFDANLTHTKDDFTDATIEARIKTQSIDTDIERRDNHLRSDDFLNAEKYPEMVFKSTSVEKTGKDTYAIKGYLTIRDSTKLVVLDAKFKGQTTDPWGNTRAVFKATTTIDRFEFGTKWNAALETGGLVVGRDVEITLLMQFIKQKNETEGKK
ncbi:MAG: YceI family protein [Ignavibacteriae bacterium]|nr:YceI family protein [Ignavibacteriota bacterium]